MSRRSALALFLILGYAAISCAQRNATDPNIRFYQWKVSKDPEYYVNYDRLGSAYAQKARETGDTAFYPLAESAFQKSLELVPSIRPESGAPLAHLAALRFSEHLFDESTVLAGKALERDPKLDVANATLGDAFLETGEYERAAFAYAKLQRPEDSITPRPGLDFLRESRTANLNFIQGNTESAIQHMKAAVQMAIHANLPKENIAWTQFSLGELYFEMGDFSKAEASYEAALRTSPGYHRALAWLAQIRSAQGKYQEAASLYRKAIAVIPLPVYVAALGDVYMKNGQAAEAKKQYGLVEYIGKLNALNQRLYNRELAIYYADHDVKLEESLELLQNELKVRHDIYTWDAYAWVLEKNHQPREAAEAMTNALRMGTKSALLFYHAGVIYESNGDPVKAGEYLRRAIATNPRFHIFYADQANRTLRSLALVSQNAADSKRGALR